MADDAQALRAPTSPDDGGRLTPDLVATDAFGVYVHVPFCRRRCPYCNFDIAVRRAIPHDRYRDAVLAELASRADEAYGAPLASLYFGGGTPSLWAPSAVADVVEAVASRWGMPAEVTLEANPDGFELELARRLAAAGINRISLGAQSLDADRLRFLGRAHTPDQARRAVHTALSCFERVSVDVIFGAPGQDVDQLAAELRAWVALGVEHISAYGLTIESRTRFAWQRLRGRRVVGDDDHLADLFDAVEDTLAPLGFVRYEVSNLAAPGAWSRHNLNYWLGGSYLGLGMGAHSLLRASDGSAVRRASGRDLRRYLADPAHDEAFRETLTTETHLGERLFTGLRTRFGVTRARMVAGHGPAAWDRYQPALDGLVADDLLVRRGEHYAPTRRGLRFADAIAARIVDAMPDAG